MANAPTSSLLDWFADREPGRTHRAGALVFVDLDLAPAVIDRVEAVGGTIRRARGYALDAGIAWPVSSQVIEPTTDGLLDCETPSGATCGAVRRELRSVWAGRPPSAGRHMVLFELDEDDVSPRPLGAR